MSQPAKAQEPSMEEILASIRRIIADDDTAKPASPPAAAAPPPRPAALPPRNPVPPSPQAADPHPVDPPPSTVMDQRGIDAMLASHDEPPAQAEDVLELTEQMAEPAPDETPSFQTIDGQSDVVFTDSPAQPEPRVVEEPRVAEEPRRQQAAPQPAVFDRSLMSTHTSAAVDSAFNALAQTVLVQNARTLEDLVKEMLRPLLKSWLDDNLPGMVERIIKAEIERVSRGRG
jgi:cell pole-organizing protein PopZ